MESKELFIKWIQTFDSSALQNEAEVETKFIIPLFQKLGYADECRRDKYPLKTYSPRKQGRKPEIDLIYFSVTAPHEQNVNTSLVIVEAKEPRRIKTELAEDLNQAKFYAYSLKAPILLVTSGKDLIAVRQHPYREVEIFNDSIEKLKSEQNAAAFFEQLHFLAVKEIKDESSSEPQTLSFEDYSPPIPIHFCGRDEELARLRAEIDRNRIIVIGGIAGIGKSYLAARLAYELKESFPIIWLNFEPQTNLEHFLSGLAHHLKNTFGDHTLISAIQTQHVTEGQRIKLAVKLLDKYNCLLVWDNYNQSTSKSFLLLLEACGQHLENGRLLITTKEWIGLESLFNVPYYTPALTALKEEDGIELLQKLGANELQFDVLKQAHDVVGGHPHLLTLLAGLSKLFPLIDLLENLPHVPEKVNEYIQRKVCETLDQNASQLLYGLSLLEIPFQLSAINHLSDTADKYQAFEKLLSRYLVTRLAHKSSLYDIHELIKAFCRNQIPVTVLSSLNKSLYAYYNALPKRTYVEGRMLVHHALNGDLTEEAHDGLQEVLFSALHEGMYDFIIEYTSVLLKDERVKSWGFVYFILGRVLRFKERYAEAKDLYQTALQFSKGTDESELAKYELASILIYLAETTEEIDVGLAKEYFNELRSSSNPETRLRAITALGTLSIREEKDECITEMEDALMFAEQIDAGISVFQLCICLGQAYDKIRNDNKQAIHYLERALHVQLEHRGELGAHNTEALYITNLELAKLYDSVGRFGDAVSSWGMCVEINRQLGLPDRLAETLNHLGRAQLKAGTPNQAKDSFLESTALINEHKLQEYGPHAHLEWLALAMWEGGEYESALEYAMVLAHLSEIRGLRPKPMPIVREADAPSQSELLRLREKGAFILVLPSLYSRDDVNSWITRIKHRRPELAAVRLMDLQKERQRNPPISIPAERKVGRNEPCPCGSKRKYKKCCGASV